jgi:hypothetical protein
MEKFLKLSRHKEVLSSTRKQSMEEMPILRGLLRWGPLMPPQNIQKFFSQDSVTIVKTLFGVWRATKSEHPRRRAGVLKLLSELPEGKWFHVSSVVALFGTSELGKMRGDDFDWEDFENTQWETVHISVLDILMDLMVLGLVDCVFATWDGEELPVGVRVNASGTQIFRPSVAASAQNSFVVLPDYSVVLTGERERQRHAAYLGKFLDTVSSDALVTVFRLSFAGMARALAQGISIQKILDYFKIHATKSVPGNVETQMREWSEAGQKIRIRKEEVVFVQCEDPYLLAEIKSIKTVQNNLLPLPEDRFLIDPKHAHAVRSAIERQNHFCVMDTKSSL